MDLKSKVAEAVRNAGEGCMSACAYVDEDKAADAAIEAIRAHAKTDPHAAHQVALYTNLRQSAWETPIQFVQRIVCAWLEEAKPVETDESEAAIGRWDGDTLIVPDGLGEAEVRGANMDFARARRVVTESGTVLKSRAA